MLRVHPLVAVLYRLYWIIVVLVCFGKHYNILSPTIALAISWSFLDVYQEVPHLAYFVLTQLARMAFHVALLVFHLVAYYGNDDTRNILVIGFTTHEKNLTLANLCVLLAFDVYSGMAFHYHSSMERKYITVPS